MQDDHSAGRPLPAVRGQLRTYERTAELGIRLGAGEYAVLVDECTFRMTERDHSAIV